RLQAVRIRSRARAAGDGRLLRGEERLHLDGGVMGRLDRKVAVITGAAGGMGREAALVFCAEGARVCVADVDRESGERTAAEAGYVSFLGVNAGAPGSGGAMYEATNDPCGGTDLFNNTAGLSPADDASVLETDVDAWDRVQNVNTRGVYLCCKYGIP